MVLCCSRLRCRSEQKVEMLWYLVTKITVVYFIRHFIKVRRFLQSCDLYVSRIGELSLSTAMFTLLPLSTNKRTLFIFNCHPSPCTNFVHCNLLVNSSPICLLSYRHGHEEYPDNTGWHPAVYLFIHFCSFQRTSLTDIRRWWMMMILSVRGS